jgi:hypothetical protein
VAKKSQGDRERQKQKKAVDKERKKQKQGRDKGFKDIYKF